MTTPQDNPTADPTLTLEQAAHFLHLGLKSMKDLVDSGEVPALSLNQKHTILLREDLIAYVREQGRAQQEQRRKGKAPPPGATAASQATATPVAPRRPPRRGKQSLPDLERYELTTGARPGSSPAGSHSA